MQYVEYEYAKEKGIVGDVIYSWLQTVRHLGIRTKGNVISDWRAGRVLMNIGETGPNTMTQQNIAAWTKAQMNPKFHNKAYQSAYLKGFFKI